MIALRMRWTPCNLLSSVRVAGAGTGSWGAGNSPSSKPRARAWNEEERLP